MGRVNLLWDVQNTYSEVELMHETADSHQIPARCGVFKIHKYVFVIIFFRYLNLNQYYSEC